MWIAQFPPPTETESMLMDIAIVVGLVVMIVMGIREFRRRR